MSWLHDLLGRLRRTREARLDLPSESLRDSLVALLAHLERRHVDCALVGGVALAARGVVRGTRDIDFLIDETAEPTVHELMSQLGFETVLRGENIATYLLAPLRVDFLVARRARGRAMLERADAVRVTSGVSAKVVQVEDLISLKLQAMIDDPARGRDRVDIEALLTTHGGKINMEAVRDYAVALGAAHELDEIVATVTSRAR